MVLGGVSSVDKFHLPHLPIREFHLLRLSKYNLEVRANSTHHVSLPPIDAPVVGIGVRRSFDTSYASCPRNSSFQYVQTRGLLSIQREKNKSIV